jgi:peptidoglycan hydrolase-like protein with peptidoglycan-binding domain
MMQALCAHSVRRTRAETARSLRGAHGPADAGCMSLRRIAALACVALLAPAATSSAATLHLGDRGLRAGASGHDVRVLQQLLTKDGFTATVDGHFGPGTAAAVRAFQRAHGLSPSGVVGQATVAALRVPAPAPATPAVASSTTATETATIDAAGLADAPAGAPPAVTAAIAAGNAIATLPYRYGGGHRSFTDSAYDCSGSVSYALRGAGLIDAPLPSGDLATWGAPGAGAWMTVYANAGHAFMVVAGLRFDTSGRSRGGSRWQAAPRSTAGFTARHPAGL